MQVRHQSPNSRWYSGAGIYRNVWMKICPAVYLPMDGTYVHTSWCGYSNSQLQNSNDCPQNVNDCRKKNDGGPQNMSDCLKNSNGSSQNMSDCPQNSNGCSQNMSDCLKNSNGCSQNMSDYPQNMNSHLQNMSDHSQNSGQQDAGCYHMEIETECAGVVRESTQCHYSLWRNGIQVRDLGWGKCSPGRMASFALL